jgi:hypothetical protein
MAQTSRGELCQCTRRLRAICRPLTSNMGLCERRKGEL